MRASHHLILATQKDLLRSILATQKDLLRSILASNLTQLKLLEIQWLLGVCHGE